jgi:inosine/xanthosine triphosphate pyrophosphatase family protein
MMRWVSDRTAKAITGVCMYTWDKYIIWYWELDWFIPDAPRWNKFWWSNAFEPIWKSKTFWEMTEYEKNQISMRKLALEDFERNLKK